MAVGKYAGIGSRKTPPNILAIMTRLAQGLAARGHLLRSGGCSGADRAFELGAQAKEIFLPWPGFQQYPSGLARLESPTHEALKIASDVHPFWSHLNRQSQLLHGRNVHQVLGAGCDDPVALILCWTPDGATHGSEVSKYTGGTGMAIRVATCWGIRVVNLCPPL